MALFHHYRLPIVSNRAHAAQTREATCGSGGFATKAEANALFGEWVGDGTCPLDLVDETWPHPSRRGQVVLAHLIAAGLGQLGGFTQVDGGGSAQQQERRLSVEGDGGESSRAGAHGGSALAVRLGG
eukprot:2722445-Prymnesium_polylepis.1